MNKLLWYKSELIWMDDKTTVEAETEFIMRVSRTNGKRRHIIDTHPLKVVWVLQDIFEDSRTVFDLDSYMESLRTGSGLDEMDMIVAADVRAVARLIAERPGTVKNKQQVKKEGAV